MKKERVLRKGERWAKLHWLRSYIAVVLAITAVLWMYSLIIVAQIRKDSDSNNNRFAAYYQTAVEKSMKSLQDYSSTLLYSEMAKGMHVYTASTMQTSEALSAGYDLVYSIRNFIMANGMVEDIYIYYPNVDYVVGSNGVYRSYVYYKTENFTTNVQYGQYEAWMQSLFTRKGNGFFVGTDELDRNTIYYYQQVLFGEQGDSSRIVVAKISGERLGISLDELVQTSNYRFVALVDADGVIYASGGEDDGFVNEESIFQADKRTQKQIIYTAASHVWPVSFVSVQDYGTAYKTVRMISGILLGGTVIALIVGVGLALYYAGKNKKEVDQLADRFDTVSNTQQRRDVAYIGDQIDKLVEANLNAVKASEEQMKTIRSCFLQELLKKNNCTEKDIEVLSALYGLSIENTMFSLVVAWNAQGENGTRLDREKIDTFLKLATDNDFDDDFVVYWTQVEHMEVFLCNYENRTRAQQGPVLEFAKCMREHCNCEIQISAVMHSSAEIVTEWAKMYTQLVPGGEQTRKTVQDQVVSALRTFNDAMDQDDLTTAIALVPELNRKLLSDPNENLVRCRKYMLTAKLYETYESDSARRRIDMLLQSVDCTDWSQRLIDFLQNIDQDINRRVDMRQVAEVAHDMIYAEYQNPQLCLHMIAENIGVSQSYLTRLFKNKYGMSVIQYLNWVRIEKAKQLMRAGTDNLKVIAASVGFLSDVTLIRVFKKYEKTTPGSFRSKEQQENL